MSGYKRVNFYELCRLCATNQQKEKTHIFREEGRKIQLQNKIQSCLSLTVCENDFLPKVVCSKCLRTLETCYIFRQECVTSESMLSSYFKNFRYTEDFKRSGKVYIKDTSTVKPPPNEHESSGPLSTSLGSLPTSLLSSAPATTATTARTSTDPLIYTVLPPIIKETKLAQNQTITTTTAATATPPPLAYNLNTINFNAIKPKNNELSNVVVNANGEVINIAAQIVDLESLINQNLAAGTGGGGGGGKKTKIININNIKKEDDVVKIDLTNDYDEKPNKKILQTSIQQTRQQQSQPTVIYNNIDFQQNFNNFQYSNTIPTTNMVICGPPGSGGGGGGGTNSSNSSGVVPTNTSSNDNQSTVNLNVLNQDITQNQQFSGGGRINNTTPTTTTTSTTPTITNQRSETTSATNNNNASNNNNNNNTNNNNISNNSNNNNKTHVCDVCQKSFKRREHLYQHVKLHTGFRPYVCECCNKSFMRKEHLLRHMTSHSGQKNFSCNICDKSFSRNDNLLKHKKTHEKQASYTCEICQKHFVMKHYYIAHKLTHDGVERLPNVWNVLKA